MPAKIKRLSHPHSFRHRHKPRGITQRAFERPYWPYLPLVISISLMFSMAVRGGATTNLSHPGEKVLGYATSMTIKDLLTDTNAQRVKDGLPPLAINGQLDVAAEAKAKNMAQLDYWSHATPNGSPPSIFVADANYTYQELGENLAAGFTNEASVVNAWMASVEHRANILNPDFTQVGFGVSQTPDFKAAGGGPMTIVVAYYALPAPNVELAVAHKSVITPTSVNRTSHAQLALAGTKIAKAGTIIAVAIIAAALGIMIGRHLIAFRRALRKGERFVASHLLMDVCFLIIVFLAYAMTQTAGFIK